MKSARHRASPPSKVRTTLHGRSRDRRCLSPWPGFGERWPSRLVATAGLVARLNCALPASISTPAPNCGNGCGRDDQPGVVDGRPVAVVVSSRHAWLGENNLGQETAADCEDQCDHERLNVAKALVLQEHYEQNVQGGNAYSPDEWNSEGQKFRKQINGNR